MTDTRDTYDHYVTWAGTGPKAREFWDLAGQISTSYAELDKLLDPFFKRAFGLPFTPEQLECIAAQELDRIADVVA